jgi:hypothetical protein
LKLPDFKNLKVPDTVANVYYDLRDRRLLPLVSLAIVAIVAVPFLLGGGDKQVPPPPLHVQGTASTSSAGSSLTVVEAQPGLRDYRKRLRARTATDPFKQRYTAPDLTGTKLGNGEEEKEEAGSGTPTATTTTTTMNVTKTTKPSGTTTKTTTDTTNESNSPSGGESGAGSTPGLVYYSFAVDVKIVHTTTAADGSKSQSEPDIRHGVLPPAPLPGEKAQVVTYMGISPKTRNPLLLVSDDVSSVFGEGHCLSGSQSCQLLEVEVGIPTTFVYGPDDARYKINITKVEPVATGHS